MSREEGNKKEGQMQQVQRLWALRQDLPDACGWRRWRNSNSKEEIVICPFQFYFVSGPITHVAILWNVEKGNLLKTLLDHHSNHPRRSPQRRRRHQILLARSPNGAPQGNRRRRLDGVSQSGQLRLRRLQGIRLR